MAGVLGELALNEDGMVRVIFLFTGGWLCAGGVGMDEGGTICWGGSVAVVRGSYAIRGEEEGEELSDGSRQTSSHATVGPITPKTQQSAR